MNPSHFEIGQLNHGSTNISNSVLPRLTSVGILLPFLPEASLAIGYCRCERLSVRPCVNHLLVRAITQDPFKLGSPNLNHRCKRPWLRFLLFGGDWPLSSRSNLTSKSKFSPFWAWPRDYSSPVQARPPNLDPMCKIPRLSPYCFEGWLSLTCQI